MNREIPQIEFAVWIDEDGGGYFMHYTSIEEAIKEWPRHEVYKTTYKNIGKYGLKTKLYKIKRRKKRAK